MALQRLTANMVPLQELLDGVSNGTVVLPDFQRDFDWTETDVRSLLATVLSGWPAGSLLAMSGASGFRIRGFEYGPSPAVDANIDYLILDGQQRLTALYHAFYGRGPYVYALRHNFELDPSDLDLDESIVFIRRDEWDKKYKGYLRQRQANLLPLYSLTSASDYYAWLDSMVSAIPADERESLRDALTRLYRTILHEAHRYQFPIVTLPARIEPAAIARIFDRVNRLGMRLGAFDLMVAQLYEPDWNLRSKWEETRSRSAIIDRFFGEDGLPILQILALKYRDDVREAAVLKLPKRLVHEQWDNATSALEKALQFLQSRCGVADPSWLPYRAMVLALGGLALDAELSHFERDLISWFWGTGFGLGYDVASNTRVVADYRSFCSAAQTQQEHLNVPEMNIQQQTLLDATRRGQGAIWRTFLCCLAQRGAADLLTGTPYNQPIDATVEAQRLGPISVFPRIPTNDLIAAPPHLRVLGLVLASRRTTNALRAMSFSELIRESIVTIGRDNTDAALRSQLFPGIDQVLPVTGDWEQILRLRLESLKGFLASEAGLGVLDVEATET